MTLPEVLLWMQLKSRKTGFLFHRQKPLGPFIGDFYCHEALLVAEVDGRIHELKGEEDLARTQWMNARGIDVRRYPAADILEDPPHVARRIAAACARRAAELQARKTPQH